MSDNNDDVFGLSFFCVRSFSLAAWRAEVVDRTVPCTFCTTAIRERGRSHICEAMRPIREFCMLRESEPEATPVGAMCPIRDDF